MRRGCLHILVTSYGYGYGTPTLLNDRNLSAGAQKSREFAQKLCFKLRILFMFMVPAPVFSNRTFLSERISVSVGKILLNIVLIILYLITSTAVGCRNISQTTHYIITSS